MKFLAKQHPRAHQFLILTIVLAFSALLFTTCFSDYMGDGMGYITVNLGGNGSRSIWPHQDPGSGVTSNDVDITITLTDEKGEKEPQTIKGKATGTIRGSVPVGQWIISIEAFYADKPYGYAKDEWIFPTNKITIRTGSNVSVKATMQRASPVCDVCKQYDECICASFEITFGQIKDETPDVDDITISRTGDPITIILAEPSQYTNIKWYIDGEDYTDYTPDTTDTDNPYGSFHLTAYDSDYNGVGEHSLTIEVEKGGVWYSKTIIFTVIP